MMVIILYAVIIVNSVILNYHSISKEKLNKEDEISSKILFDFIQPEEVERWISVNDDVMGGYSKSYVSLTSDNCLSFTGSISLENNGGFASIRTLPTNFEMSNVKGIRIKVKGDGRKYQFRIRTDNDFDGISYRYEFEPEKDKWIEIDLYFSLFQPTYRGNILQNIPELNSGEIRQIGFLLADKIEGEFELLIDRISAIQ